MELVKGKPEQAQAKLPPSGMIAAGLLMAMLPCAAIMSLALHGSVLASAIASLTFTCFELAIIVTSVFGGLSIMEGLKELHPTSKIAGLMWLAAAGYANLVASAAPASSALLMVISLIHMLFLFCVSSMMASRWRDVRIAFVQALGIGVSVYAVMAFAYALSLRDIVDYDWTYFELATTNVRHLGYYGLTAATIGMALQVKARSNRATAFTLTTAGYFLLLWSGGRASFGAAVLVFILLWAILTSNNRTRRRTFMAQTIGAVFVAAPLSMIYVPSPSWGLMNMFGRSYAAQDANQLSNGRFNIWHQTWEAVLQHPWSGYGQGQFRSTIPAALNTYAQPHNAILQFLFEWGVFGLTAIALLGGAVLLRHRRTIQAAGPVALAGFAPVAGLCAMAMLDGALHYPYPIIVVVVGFAILASLESPERDQTAALN